MTTPYRKSTFEMDRGRQLIRVLRVMQALSTREFTLPELASRSGVAIKTVRRDIALIQGVGVIVNQRKDVDYESMKMTIRYRIDRNWLGKFR